MTTSNLTFQKDYRHKEPMRLAFDQLATEVFDLSFEDWYQAGYWTETYKPYTFFDGDKAVANVSISVIALNLGESSSPGSAPVPAVQVGTVMTHPHYRRRGLAKALFDKVFEDFPPSHYIYFLAADDMAVPLYTQCGFEPWEETRFCVNLGPAKPLEEQELEQESPKPQIGLSTATLAPDALWDLNVKSTQINMGTNPLTVYQGEAILLFYYTLGFSETFYTLGEGIIVSLGDREDSLDLYGIWSTDPVSQEEVIGQLAQKATGWGYSQMRILFTPPPSLPGLVTSPDKSNQWMVHGGTGRKFPANARFPKLFQT